MNPEIEKNIVSRARALSHRFARWGVSAYGEDDLRQEGYLLVYEIQKENPEADLKFILKSINNLYSNIQRNEIRRKKKTIEFDEEEEYSFPEREPTPQADWGKITERFIKLKNKESMTPLEICKRIGVPSTKIKFNSILQRKALWRKLMNVK